MDLVPRLTTACARPFVDGAICSAWQARR
jgi:hypothetical protein